MCDGRRACRRAQCTARREQVTTKRSLRHRHEYSTDMRCVYFFDENKTFSCVMSCQSRAPAAIGTHAARSAKSYALPYNRRGPRHRSTRGGYAHGAVRFTSVNVSGHPHARVAAWTLTAVSTSMPLAPNSPYRMRRTHDPVEAHRRAPARTHSSTRCAAARLV